jgi:hypothetical protein
MIEALVDVATESQLRELVESSLIYESHFLDFKSELDSNDKLAKNLAAFAIDGGAIVVGVEETRPARVPALRPIPLPGLRERVDQLSKSRIMPRLVVRVREIQSEQHHLGYLIILIPPSPDAPHMVDGRYWSRDDTTRRELSDPEVRRLLAMNSEGKERSSDSLVAEEIARDPLNDSGGATPRLHVIAEPIVPRQEMLWDVASNRGGWAAWVKEAVIPASFTDENRWFDDDWSIASRANGCALHTEGISRDRHVERLDREVLDIEFRDDGGIRLYDASIFPEDELRDRRLVRLVARVVASARLVTRECNYLGAWDLAVAITDMAGVPAASARRRVGDATGFSAPDYRQSLRITAEALADDAIGVTTRRLLARLGRALEVEQQILTASHEAGIELGDPPHDRSEDG